MSIRSHLIALVLFCAVGGLTLGVFLIDRQYAINRDNINLAQLNQHTHEIERLEDQIKQLMITTDLLFGSGETYMLAASLQNVARAIKLARELSPHGVTNATLRNPRNSPTAMLQLYLAELQREIQTLQERSSQTTLANIKGQLQQVDELMQNMVIAIEAVRSKAQGELQSAQLHHYERQSRSDLLAWGAVAAYLLSLLASLWLSSRAVSTPLTRLSTLANRALSREEKFLTTPEGPKEVRSLARNLSQLVDSLEHQNAQSKALIQAIPDALFVVHRERGIVRIKSGVDADHELVSDKPSRESLKHLLGEEQTAKAIGMIADCLRTQNQQQSHLTLSIDNTQKHFEARATAINSDQVVFVVRDLTEKHLAEARIRHMAYHDSLTGLLNRRAFKEALKQHCDSNPDGKLALFYIDVDRFKSINDTHGHDSGDAVLKHVTSSLSKCLRTNDTLSRGSSLIKNLSARMGGDEFVLLLPGIDNEQTANLVAKRLQDAASTPFKIGSSTVSVTLSIGMALYPEHGTDSDTLMHHADLAMYHVKRSGGATAGMYADQLGSQSNRKLSIEAKLKIAIEKEHLFLTYQPKIELASRTIVGAEALVRWQDGDKVVPPDEFIPIAEETGLIVPLGEYVTRTAVEQMAEWQRSKAGQQLRTMAINVSAAQLKQSDFYQSVRGLILSSGLQPSALNIEITESLLMGQYDNALKVLTELRDGGFTIAMDDFGTGYSSLSYIKDLPLDILKIDRTFVSGISASTTERAIIAAIIQLGKTLGLRIVAEGVETEEHAKFLETSQCDEAQGYLFSPPVKAEIFEHMLESHATTRSIQAAS